MCKHKSIFFMVLVFQINSFLVKAESTLPNLKLMPLNKAIVLSTQPFSAEIGGDSSRIPPNESLDLLSGWDSVSATPRAKCVAYAGEIPEPSVSPPQNGSLDLDEGNSLEQFFSSLKISASASLGIGAFKSDASYQLMKTSKLNTYSEYLRVTNSFENQRQLLDTDKISASKLIKENLEKKNFNEFYRLCGDSFIVGKITGGIFTAVYTSDSRTYEEQLKTRATFKAAYSSLSGGGGISAEVENSLEQLNKSGSLKLHILRVGANDKYPDASPKALLEYARNYGTSVANSGTSWTVGYIIARYEYVLPNLKIPPISGLSMDDEARYQRALYQRISDIRYMIQHQEEFGPFPVNRANEEISKIQTVISRRSDMIESCAARTKNCDLLSIKNYDDSVTSKPAPGRMVETKIVFDQFRRFLVASALGDDAKVVEFRGTYGGCLNNLCKVTSRYDDRNRWIFMSRRNPLMSVEVGNSMPFLLPPNSDAYFYINTDPRAPAPVPDPKDPPRLETFEPLYPDVYVIPPGTEKF